MTSLATRTALRYTRYALASGTVLHVTLRGGEVLTAGRYSTAVGGRSWALLGHNSDRLERFDGCSELARRLLSLSQG